MIETPLYNCDMPMYGLRARFVSLRTLIEMKTAAIRTHDIDDVQHLRWIEEERRPYG